MMGERVFIVIIKKNLTLCNIETVPFDVDNYILAA